MLRRGNNKVAIIETVSTRRHKLSSNEITLLLMAIPCVVLVIVFNYVPLFGWVYGFFNYRPGISLLHSQFVGLDFFKIALQNDDLFVSIKNTLALGFLGLGTSIFPPIFAILMTELSGKKFKKVIQTVVTFPNFISWVLVFAIFFSFLSVEDGYVNKFLLALGIIKQPLNLLADPNAVWPLQTFIGVWKSLGFSTIIYLAAIAGIDQELYDAAAVDGCNRTNRIYHITFPALIPTYFTLLLLGIGNILSNGFDQYYLFYNPLVHSKIMVLDVYLYKVGLEMNQLSLSIVLGMTKSLISIFILFMANYFSKLIRGTSIL